MIKGFISDNGTLVDFEDYEKKRYLFDLPDPILKTIMHEFRDNPHKGEYVSITALLGCIRSTYFSRICDTYVKPRNSWWSLRGSLIHEIIESAEAGDDIIAEENFSIPLNGVEVFGRIDWYDKRTKHLTDFKSIGDLGIKFILRDGAKVDHIRQTNMYRVLLEEAGYPVESISIVYLSMMSIVETGTLFVDKKGVEHNIPAIELYDKDKIKKFMLERAKIYHLAFEEGQLPPIPDEQTRKWMCSPVYCHSTDVCPYYQELELEKEKIKKEKAKRAKARKKKGKKDE